MSTTELKEIGDDVYRVGDWVHMPYYRYKELLKCEKYYKKVKKLEKKMDEKS